MGVNCWRSDCESPIGTTDSKGLRYCPTHALDRWPEPDNALPGLCIFDGAIHERTWLYPNPRIRNGLSRACLRHYRVLVKGQE